jgi:hypothetical protein
MPGSKRLGKAAKMLDDEGVIDAVDSAAGMLAGGGNNPQDVDALKNRGTNQSDFSSSFSRPQVEDLEDDAVKQHRTSAEPLSPHEGLDSQDKNNKRDKLKDGTQKEHRGLGLGKTNKDELREIPAQVQKIVESAL